MAFSSVSYTGDGVQKDFTVTFNYLDQSHVKVRVDKVFTDDVASAYKITWINSTTIRVDTVIEGNPPPSGAEIELIRQTPINTPAVVFGGGASLSSENLNKNSDYLTFALQEATDANEAFTKLYLGAFTFFPTTDNDGDPLQAGAVIYYIPQNALYYYTDLGTWVVGESTIAAQTAQAAAEAAQAAAEAAQAGAEAAQAGAEAERNAADAAKVAAQAAQAGAETARTGSETAQTGAQAAQAAAEAAQAAAEAISQPLQFAYYKFTASASQTVFTGADDNAQTLSVNTDAAIVTLNGIKLVPGTDYTATATTITLATGAALNDELEVLSFDVVSLLAENTMPTAGGTFTGPVTHQSQEAHAAGSEAAPGITFAGDLDTGFWRKAADQVSLVLGGVEKVAVAASQFVHKTVARFTDGTAAAPSITFDADPDTGFFRDADDKLSVTVGGVKVAEFDSGGLTLGASGGYNPNGSWQDVLPSRATLTAYQNTTPYTIQVHIEEGVGDSSNGVELSSDGVNWLLIHNINAYEGVTFSVLPGHYYRITSDSITDIKRWHELR
jgi:multidrug efflux pump subunit AcrA (membrane-fusion protein)